MKKKIQKVCRIRDAISEHHIRNTLEYHSKDRMVMCVCAHVRVCKGENTISLFKNKVRNRYDSLFR